MTDRDDGESEDARDGLDELQPPATELRTAAEAEAQAATGKDTSGDDAESAVDTLDELQPPASELRSAVERDAVSGGKEAGAREGGRDE